MSKTPDWEWSEFAAFLAQTQRRNQIMDAAEWAATLWVEFKVHGLSQKSAQVAAALNDWQPIGGELPFICLTCPEHRALSAAWFLRNGMMPPQSLALFASDVLDDYGDGGARARKPTSSKDRVRVFLIFGICFLAKLKPKRSSTLDKALRKGKRRHEAALGTIEGNSGCDIAARVLGISYDRCLGIWKKREPELKILFGTIGALSQQS